MKNTLFVSLAMLGIGIGIGWLARASMDDGKTFAGSPVAAHPAPVRPAEVVSKPSSTMHKQLEQYRTELKTKGAGMYGAALMGMGAEGSKVDFVFPAK